MSLTLDLSEFLPVMETYLDISKLSNADALNKKAVDVAKTAAQFTPAATKSQIKSELTSGDPHLLAALTSLHLRSIGTGILPPPLFKQAMQLLVRARYGGIKYLRSGWFPCIEALGSVVRGGRGSKSPGKSFSASGKSTAAYGKKTGIHSTASPATPMQLTAVIEWVTDQPTAAKQESAERVAFKALQESIDYQTSDMGDYIADRLDRALN